MRNLLLYATDLSDTSLLKFLNFKQVSVNKPITDLPQNGNFEYISHLEISEVGQKLTDGKIKQILTKRKSYHIISVEAISPKISSLAVRDGRVDAILITSKSSIKVFNRKFARRLEEYNTLVFLDLSSFFTLKASKIRPLLRVINVLKKSDIHFILTNKPKNLGEYRSYRSLQALAKMLELTSTQTSTKPLLERVVLNKKKIEGEIPFIGIQKEDDE